MCARRKDTEEREADDSDAAAGMVQQDVWYEMCHSREGRCVRADTTREREK